MKRIFNIIVSVALLAALSGCEKEPMSYEGETGVYFSIQRGPTYGARENWPYYPYSPLEFVLYAGETQHTISLQVRVAGNLADHPRTFRYEIDPETTTAAEGTDYVKPSGEAVIPAGQRDGFIDLVVNRTAAMKAQTLKIGLRLVANENFSLAFTDFEQPPILNAGPEGVIETFDATRHIVKVSDILAQPPVWSGALNSTYGQGEEFQTLGQFTVKKFNLICEITGVTYSDFLTNPPMTDSYMRLIGRRVGDYLKQQYRNGTPVLEDDGRLMWVDGVKWKSYPGTAWDGTIIPDYFY